MYILCNGFLHGSAAILLSIYKYDYRYQCCSVFATVGLVEVSWPLTLCVWVVTVWRCNCMDDWTCDNLADIVAKSCRCVLLLEGSWIQCGGDRYWLSVINWQTDAMPRGKFVNASCGDHMGAACLVCVGIWHCRLSPKSLYHFPRSFRSMMLKGNTIFKRITSHTCPFFEGQRIWLNVTPRIFELESIASVLLFISMSS